MKILFVVQAIGGYRRGCGIAIEGQLIGKSLVKSKKYDFEILYTDSEKELEHKILTSFPRAIIYNYHPMTTLWMEKQRIRKRFPEIAHIMRHCDMYQDAVNTYHPAKYFGFKYLVAADPTLKGNKHVFPVNRFIPPYTPKPYTDKGIPIIGFQGFGLPHKGIHRIAEKVQEEFDEAIIRLHIPFSFYADSSGKNAKKRIEEVLNIIKKPGIKVEASHNLMSTEEIVEFLSENTINCYFYDYLFGAGLASAPDYALAAKRPIAVTKSHQMRHLIELTPSICIEDNSLKDIISFGTKPLEKLYQAYSEESLIKGYEAMLDTILEKLDREMDQKMRRAPRFLIRKSYKRSSQILNAIMTRSPADTAKKIVSKLKRT